MIAQNPFTHDTLSQLLLPLISEATLFTLANENSVSLSL